MTDLGTLGGRYSQRSEAYGINDHGQVVGASGNRDFSDVSDAHGWEKAERAFLWQEGTMTRLNIAESRASAINLSGQIVGASDLGHAGPSAFLWQKGRVSLRTLKGHTDKVVSADVSPDGKRVLTASADGTARIAAVSQRVGSACCQSGE